MNAYGASWYASEIATAERTLASDPSPAVASACQRTIARARAMIAHCERVERDAYARRLPVIVAQLRAERATYPADR